FLARRAFWESERHFAVGTLYLDAHEQSSRGDLTFGPSLFRVGENVTRRSQQGHKSQRVSLPSRPAVASAITPSSASLSASPRSPTPRTRCVLPNRPRAGHRP